MLQKKMPAIARLSKPRSPTPPPKLKPAFAPPATCAPQNKTTPRFPALSHRCLDAAGLHI